MKMYESEEDKRNQRAAMEKVEKLFNWHLMELPIGYGPDWIAYEREDEDYVTTGFVEYKRRNNNHDAFPTVFLEYKKYINCKLMSDASAVPFYYIQEWDDHKLGICHVGIKDVIRSRVGIRSSMRRDDINDTYLQIHLPLERFDLYAIPKV